MRRFALLIVMSAVSSLSRPTSADEDTTRRFEEGKALMEKKDYAAACVKFDEVYGAERGTGALLALALCHEQEGRLATALHEFQEVIPLARRQKREDRALIAKAHIDALVPRVPKLRVIVADEVARRPGLVLSCDGNRLYEIVGPLELDPGSHTIDVTAPGYAPFRTTVVLEPGQEIGVEVGGSSGGAPPVHIRRETVGIVVGGVGVAAALVGSYAGVRALNSEAEAKRRCPPQACSDYRAVTLAQDAKSLATISNVSFAIAIAGLGVGAFLIFGGQGSASAAPPRTASRVAMVPTMGPNTVGLAIEGTAP
jgi:hypothetical protein